MCFYYVTQEQDFSWDSKQKGVILSSFFYGYIVTQFIGGWISSRMAGNLVFGIGIFATSLLTLFTPLTANGGYYAMIAIRVLEGIFEGVTFPCLQVIWSRWAPPEERSRFGTFTYMGVYVGTVVSMLLSGIFAENFGWQSVFYVFGMWIFIIMLKTVSIIFHLKLYMLHNTFTNIICTKKNPGVIGCIWFLVWIFVVKESPQKDNNISKEELDYILRCQGNMQFENVKHPWKAIFTSIPVYAICMANFTENWGLYTLNTQMPTFLKGFGFQIFLLLAV